MTLYEKIITQDVSTDPKAFLAAMNLHDAWDLLDKIPFEKRDDKMRVLKYVARLYDPHSELHTLDRDKVKKSEMKVLGCDDSIIWVDIAKGKCRAFNDFVTYYYITIVRDPEWESYITGLEWVAYQLSVVRDAPAAFTTEEIPLDGKSTVPEDKRMKALELTQKMWVSSQENINDLKQMKRELDAKYEKSDDNFNKEINKDMVAKSGATVRFMLEKGDKTKEAQ